jgi:hypothetical protein
MKKKQAILLIISGFFLFSFSVFGRDGDNVVKTTIRLVPESNFGAGVDWDSVFSGYQGRGTYKDMVRFSDGRFVVSDSRTYNLLLFDADGHFMKRIWNKGRRNPEELSIYGRPLWLSQWADKLLLVYEMGRLRIFDLQGREVRNAVIDHAVECLFPLDEGNIVLAGWVLRQNMTDRYIAARFDVASGKETVVMDNIESRAEKSRETTLSENGTQTGVYTVTEGATKISVTFPFTQIRPVVRPTQEGGFLAGFSNWPEIEVYDKTGKQLRTFMLKTEPAAIEWSWIQAQTPRAMERDAEINSKLPPGLRDKIHFGASFYPIQKMPYFYNLYVDDAGEIMVFVFPAEGKNPVYQVYSPMGELKRQVTILSDEYNVSFSPAGTMAVFADGYLYALAEKKGQKGVPLRLVKFKLVEK